MDVPTLISPDEVWGTLFEASPHALLLLDPSAERIVKANRRTEESYGYAVGEMNGLEIREILEPGDGNALVRLTTTSSRSSFINGGWHRRQDGTTFYARIHVTEIKGVGAPLRLVSVVDPSESDLIDSASGLPDPRLFVDRLEQCIVHAHRSGRGLGVCLVLFSRLEELLDDLRVQPMRRLLHDVADRLKVNLRESDTVARIGRAEFALVIEGLTEENALLEVLRKVSADFEYEIRVGDEELILAPSFGVSVYPHDGHVADMLVGNAAEAARLSLQGGGGQIRFFG